MLGPRELALPILIPQRDALIGTLIVKLKEVRATGLDMEDS